MLWQFQSTLPRGERPLNIFCVQLPQGISIHAPARGATSKNLENGGRIKISIHAPARGATPPRIFFARCSYNFNPRSREGSDRSPKGYGTRDNISIHAPARGATHFLVVRDPKGLISIHAPARGATVRVDMRRTSHGISIHAPARGATSGTGWLCHCHCDFNPRSREGSD